jgi:hypothetical protein
MEETYTCNAYKCLTFFANFILVKGVEDFIKATYYDLWRVPKFLGRPIWGSNYVEMRKELELGAAPNFQH